ncbi:MAG: hypothetical protein GF350_10615 [Chitinivibrionales bacterium]|nr:hypothetical protein [Chitinivibrionales bacterium]
MHTANKPGHIWKLKQVLHAAVLDELEKDFVTAHIRYMPVKGSYLICTGLAEKMQRRTMNDIDILVLPDDFEKAANYFRTLDKTEPRQQESWPFADAFYYRIGDQKIMIELHCMINFPDRFLLPPELLMKRGIHTGGMRVHPCPEDALLITICHMLVHAYYIPDNAVYSEMKLIIEQGDFSWNRFWHRSKSTGIAPYIYYVLKLCNRRTGIPVEFSSQYLYADLLLNLPDVRRIGKAVHGVRYVFIGLAFSRNPLRVIMRKTTKIFGSRFAPGNKS